MQWHPQKGEQVITTPVDSEDFGVLTRLERVAGLVPLRTTSGREFKGKGKFSANGNQSFLEWGRFRMLQATPERIEKFKKMRLHNEMQQRLLETNWEDLIWNLSEQEVRILDQALRTISGAAEEKMQDVVNLEAVKYFYFLRRPRTGIPVSATHVIRNISGEYYVLTAYPDRDRAELVPDKLIRAWQLVGILDAGNSKPSIVRQLHPDLLPPEIT